MESRVLGYFACGLLEKEKEKLEGVVGVNIMANIKSAGAMLTQWYSLIYENFNIDLGGPCFQKY